MKIKNSASRTLESIVQNNLPISASTFAILESTTNLSTSQTLSLSCLTYLILSSIDDYALKKISPFPNKYISNIRKTITNNPNIVGGVTALGVGIAGILGIETNTLPRQEIEILKQEYLTIIPLASASATSLAIRYQREIKRIKESVKKIKTNLPEKIWNFTFEHPLLFGGAISFYELIKFEMESRLSRKEANINYEIPNVLYITPATISLGLGLAAGLVTSIAAGFLHTHSLRYWKHKIKSSYYKKTKNNKALIKEQKQLADLPNSIEKRIKALIDLADSQKNYGDEEFIKNYKKAIKLLSKKDIYSSFINFIKPKRKSLENIRAILNKKYINDNYSSGYLYGKLLEITGDIHGAKREKIEAVKLAVKQGTKQHGKSKNIVLRLEDKLLNDLIIVKTGTEEELDAEEKTNKKIREVITAYDKYYVPKPIGIWKDENNYKYAMEFEDGNELSKEILNKTATLEDFMRIIDFMSLIQTKIYSKELKERNHIEVIKKKLSIVSIDKEIIDLIYNNLHPCIESLKPIPRVCNIDAHPNNWIITSDRDITKIDTEEGRLIPATFDTSNLLDFLPYLNTKQKYFLADYHRKAISKHSLLLVRSKKEKFKLAYLNSSIERALEFRGSPAYEERWKDMLLNSLKSIEEIKLNFPEYYKINEKEYRNLRTAIHNII